VPVAELPLDLGDALMLPLLGPVQLVMDPEERGRHVVLLLVIRALEILVVAAEMGSSRLIIFISIQASELLAIASE
jgi:hypothetical protein